MPPAPSTCSTARSWPRRCWPRDRNERALPDQRRHALRPPAAARAGARRRAPARRRVADLSRRRAETGARQRLAGDPAGRVRGADRPVRLRRSEEHTSELQSQFHLVCRLLLEKKKKKIIHKVSKKKTKKQKN